MKYKALSGKGLNNFSTFGKKIYAVKVYKCRDRETEYTIVYKYKWWYKLFKNTNKD